MSTKVACVLLSAKLSSIHWRTVGVSIYDVVDDSGSCKDVDPLTASNSFMTRNEDPGGLFKWALEYIVYPLLSLLFAVCSWSPLQ